MWVTKLACTRRICMLVRVCVCVCSVKGPRLSARLFSGRMCEHELKQVCRNGNSRPFGLNLVCTVRTFSPLLPLSHHSWKSTCVWGYIGVMRKSLNSRVATPVHTETEKYRSEISVISNNVTNYLGSWEKIFVHDHHKEFFFWYRFLLCTDRQKKYPRMSHTSFKFFFVCFFLINQYM